MIERTIGASTHGRYLVAPPTAVPAPPPLLVGFHGYAENAETHLARLTSIPGSDAWIAVSVEGLHRFYRGRSVEVVASWMTRQDRELAIADNIGYVAAVVDAVAREWAAGPQIAFAGFSQGVAMAFRAAAASPRRVRGVLALGADIAPELDTSALARIPQVLIGRGLRDEWYTAEKFAADLDRLRLARVAVRPIEFCGGHEWADAFNAAAGACLREWR